MLLARLILVVQILVFAGFGLAYWFRPYEMANLSGMLLMETASVSNVRVYYGGLQVGLALFLLWALRGRELMRAALMMLLLVQSALALARIGSLWLDDGTLQNFDISSWPTRWPPRCWPAWPSCSWRATGNRSRTPR